MKIVVITPADVWDQELYCEGSVLCSRTPEPIVPEDYVHGQQMILCWEHWLKKYGYTKHQTIEE